MITEHKMLLNLGRFQYLDFREILDTTNWKKACPELYKISKKNIEHGKNVINFSEVTPNCIAHTDVWPTKLLKCLIFLFFFLSTDCSMAPFFCLLLFPLLLF